MIIQRYLIGASVALVGSAGIAAAQSAGCAAVDGFFAPNSLISGQFTNLAFDEGEIVTLTASSISSDGGFRFLALEPDIVQSGAGAFRFTDGSRTPISGSFAYPNPSGPISETLVVPNGVIGLGWTEDVSLGGFFTEFTDLGISCAIVPSFVVSPELPQITAMGQQRVINNALSSNIDSRLGRGGGNIVSRDSVFMSTKNFEGEQQVDASLWFAVNSRFYFDGYEGHSLDFTAGADYLLNDDTLLGVMLGAGISDLEDSVGNETQTDALLAGIYGGYRFSGTDIIVDGYLNYAAVDYDTGAATFETDRILAGLKVSGSYGVSGGTVSPRASILGTWEDFPAGTVGTVGGTTQNTLVSVGANMTWDRPLGATPLQPFASLDLEYGMVEEVGGLSDDFFAPRIGLGISGAMGGGDLALSFDAGRTTSDVIDVGLVASYELKF